MKEIEVGRFECRDQDGNSYTVIRYEGVVPAPTSSDPNATIPGMRRLALAEGKRVNYLGGTTFRIVQSGKTIRKV